MRVIDFFDKGAQHNPDRELIVSDEGTVTYAEATEHTWRLAAGLYANGFELGDGVGIFGPNVAEGFLAMLGVWRAGAAWTPLNPHNALSATIDFMNEVQIKYLLVHSRFADKVEEIRANVPTLRLVVSLDKPFEGAVPMADFLASGEGTTVPDWSDPFGRPDHVAATYPTGGTTGASKAVIITNEVFATMFDLCTRHWPQAEHPVNLMVAPITHAAGIVAVIAALQGGTVVIRPGFDADDAVDCIEKHGVTHMFVPPTAYYGMLAAQKARRRDTSSLKMLLLAAAPVSPDKFGEGVEAFGPCIAQCWGQAESPMILTYLTPEQVAAAATGEHPERLASCGFPTFSSQVAVMDDDGRLLPPGERGELVARGRIVTPGYHNHEKETAEIRTHGWHHTGDVGYIDEDGFVYIVDRKKEMIITGGFNVYPAEIEAAVLALPEVHDCAVIGIPDERWGEMVCALVVPEQGGFDDAEYVMAEAKKALGSVKAPKVVHFMQSLPMTGAGKKDKKAMRAKFWDGMGRSVN